MARISRSREPIGGLRKHSEDSPPAFQPGVVNPAQREQIGSLAPPSRFGAGEAATKLQTARRCRSFVLDSGWRTACAARA